MLCALQTTLALYLWIIYKCDLCDLCDCILNCILFNPRTCEAAFISQSRNLCQRICYNKYLLFKFQKYLFAMGEVELFVSLEEVEEEQGGGGEAEDETNNQKSLAMPKIKGNKQTYSEHESWGNISTEAVTIQMMPVSEDWNSGYSTYQGSGEIIGKDHHNRWELEESEEVNETHLEKSLEERVFLVKEGVKATAAHITAKVTDSGLAPSKRKIQSDSERLLNKKQKKILPKEEEDDEKDDCPLCIEEGSFFSAEENEMAKHFFEVHNIMDQGYECTVCGFKSKERNYLIDHINFTHRQLKFCCDLCDYQTMYRNRVKSHKVSVHRVGGMPCSSCAYIAPEIWVLGQHRRAMHKDFGDKEADIRYKCNYCDYQATQRSHLKSHMAALHQQLVFCCDMCDFQSRWKSRMMAHTRAKHMGIFLFCDHCEFKTVEKHSLKVHIKKKHGDIQFACFSCNDNFLTRIELRKHMSDVHYMQTL